MKLHLLLFNHLIHTHTHTHHTLFLFLNLSSSASAGNGARQQPGGDYYQLQAAQTEISRYQFLLCKGGSIIMLVTVSM